MDKEALKTIASEYFKKEGVETSPTALRVLVESPHLREKELAEMDEAAARQALAPILADAVKRFKKRVARSKSAEKASLRDIDVRASLARSRLPPYAPKKVKPAPTEEAPAEGETEAEAPADAPGEAAKEE
jgi:hypothetical protein